MSDESPTPTLAERAMEEATALRNGREVSANTVDTALGTSPVREEREREREQHTAWMEVWRVCMELGMKTTLNRGLDNVTHFIRSLSVLAPESAPPPRTQFKDSYAPASVGYAERIFDLLDHWTPEQRARVFYEIENLWCWDCGYPQADDDAHLSCGKPNVPRGAERGDRNASTPISVRSTERELTDDVR